MDVEVLRRAWPEILQTLTKIKRSTWALVEPNAQVGHFEDHVLTLAFTTSGLAGAFGRADHAENLRQAIHKSIGIDCQIVAVAAGNNGSASSEPNPKAPASPAGTTDAAWGLTDDAGPAIPDKRSDGAREDAGAATPAPTDAQVPAPAPAPASFSTAAPASAPAPAPAPAPAASFPAPAETAPIATFDAAAETPGTGSLPPAQPAAAGTRTPEPEPPLQNDAGSYADPDDDWGPPRDEDAPPLDEEPPMDWVPGPPVPRPADPAPSQSPVLSRRTLAERRSEDSSDAHLVSTSKPAPATADDPWERATEHSAGIWTVGGESNVGRYEPPSGQPAAPAEPVIEPEPPHYEPAAAQVPAQGGAPADAAANGWGSETPETPSSPKARGTGSATAPVAVVPAVPMADAVAPVPAPAGKQSLYQRLSSSPEAEAGRATAPAKTAVTTYVQDVPSADDETIEESGVFGRAAVERILGGKLVEERSLDGSPLLPRF